MGFFISVAGGICREESGAALREAVSYIVKSDSVDSPGPFRMVFLQNARPWFTQDMSVCCTCACVTRFHLLMLKVVFLFAVRNCVVDPTVVLSFKNETATRVSCYFPSVASIPKQLAGQRYRILLHRLDSSRSAALAS